MYLLFYNLILPSLIGEKESCDRSVPFLIGRQDPGPGRNFVIKGF
jgi:hypothetical protein